MSDFVSHMAGTFFYSENKKKEKNADRRKGGKPYGMRSQKEIMGTYVLELSRGPI